MPEEQQILVFLPWSERTRGLDGCRVQDCLELKVRTTLEFRCMISVAELERRFFGAAKALAALRTALKVNGYREVEKSMYLRLVNQFCAGS
jgi:hypothetical protein